jgi:hypothetical protein
MTYTEEQYDEFVKTLEAKYPLMFSQPYGGIAVGTGWWPIIESLCANIQSHVDWKNEQRDRFQRGEGCQQVVVEQIKEKFGGLRFYYQGGNEQIHGMVRMAEAWAAHSCEECGRPGKSRSGGWVRTLCDEHEAERQARMAAYRESMPT